MSWELLLKASELAFILLQAAALLFMFLMKSTFATRKDVGVIEKHAGDAHHRLALLEQRVDQLPTKFAIDGLREDVSGLKADMRENSVRVETAVLGVKRIEDFLLGSKS